MRNWWISQNPVTTRKPQKGDILSLNCFSMISGYYTALERTLFLESCTDRELEIWEPMWRFINGGWS